MNGGSITYPDANTKQLTISGSLPTNQSGPGVMDDLFAMLARKAMSRSRGRGVNNRASVSGPAAPGVFTDPLTKAIQQNAMNADLAASNMDLTRMRQKMGPYVFNSNRPPLS
jgi:hypothetical protein